MNKLILKLFFLLFCFSITTSVFAQEGFQQKKDSLKKVIAATQGKEKLDRLMKCWHSRCFIMKIM